MSCCDNLHDVTSARLGNPVGRTMRQSADELRLRYCYDARGNVTRYRQRLAAGIDIEVDLTHDLADNLDTITYPSGLTVTYSRDAAGRITSASATGDGVNETLVSSIQYEPFGPMKSWTYGNGIAANVGHDLDYRIDDLTHDNVLGRDYAYDDAGNITAIADTLNGQYSQTFGYDELHRLASVAGDYGTKSFTYDGIGNRETKVENSTPTTIVMETNSHRIETIDGVPITHDDVGNIEVDNEGRTFTFGDNNRMQTSAVGATSATYAYNAKGERASKTVDGVTTYFLYGLNGELLGEYDDAGEFIREYVWVNGQIVANHQPAQFAPEVVDETEATDIGKWEVYEDPAFIGGSAMRLLSGTRGEGHLDWDLSAYSGDFTVFANVGVWGAGQGAYTVDDGQNQFTGTFRLIQGWVDLGAYTFSPQQGPASVRVTGLNYPVYVDAIAIVPTEKQGNTQPPPLPYVPPFIVYHHNDHLGTPQALTDESGTVVWQASYHPFGETDILVDTVENNIRFPGQYFDAETGLHYNYFRDYNPDTGRYVESDPILKPSMYFNEDLWKVVPYVYVPGFDGHGYTYVASTPITTVDETGLGLLNCIRCWFLADDFGEASEECDEEWDDCETVEEQIEFYDKYEPKNFGFGIGGALLECGCQKMGTLQCQKMITECGACPIGLGPLPSKANPKLGR